MKAQLRNQVAALFLLLPAAAVLVALPAAAVAQQAAPEVQSLQVASDGGLDAGSRLQFTVEGTPRAQASVRIQGIQRNIPLREVSRGVYTGGYTIKRQDRIDESSPIRATLRARNRSVSANYGFPAGIAGQQVAVAPFGGLKIERFSVAPVDRIEPGVELNPPKLRI